MKIFSMIAICVVIAATTFSAEAQRRQRPNASSAKPVVFAVLADGKSIEPIAFINSKTLEAIPTGESNSSAIKNFGNLYYSKKNYRLVFGGADSGTVAVLKQSVGECAGNSADVLTKSPKAKLKGMVMGLAVSESVKANIKSYRRMPTSIERAEIDKLVLKELSAKAGAEIKASNLRYHNLTAVDLNADGKPEFIGSYWTEPRSGERLLLFTIAEKTSNEKYALSHVDLEQFKKDNVMSGDLADVDSGIYNTLLLDVLDYDGDGDAEIFTTMQGFEGRNFAVYKRDADKKWKPIFEGFNYRCGY